MNKADEYQAKAAECDKQAGEITDPEAKRMMHEAAEGWRKLAEQARQRRW